MKIHVRPQKGVGFREEATTMDCPSSCLTDGTPFVEVTYKEWDCQDGVASISVQVLVRCDVI